MSSVEAGKYGTAAMRWAGVGPYYAMFPFRFALETITRHTRPGDVVFDPFAGRGTSLFAAAITGRLSIGMEITPVGYAYSKAKLSPATKNRVMSRLASIESLSHRYAAAADALPEFFHRCYCEKVRRFLVASRNALDWRHSKVDGTVMALLLIHLHGKRSDSFSNQMRQTKALSPPYAIRWWQERGLCPPDIDPLAFMERKIRWRYAYGRPEVADHVVILGDSERKCHGLGKSLQRLGKRCVNLLLTSPPYCGVTNYHYDQWLRLWLLGGPDHPTAPTGPNRGRFVDQDKYWALLRNVFCASAERLAKEAVVYVRTDSRPVTFNATIDALSVAFPRKAIVKRTRPIQKPTQTALFGGLVRSVGEVDIVLR